MTAQVIEIELANSLLDDTDLRGHNQAFVLVRYHDRPLGSIRVVGQDGKLLASDLRAAIAADYWLSYSLMQILLGDWLTRHETLAPRSLPSWSVVICTRDRPNDLRSCLDSLLKLQSVDGEIIVVDNAPADDATARLVAGYPVRYVREDRVGLNWARSCGARMANGEVVIFTDDDAVVDSHWVAAILEPFDNPRVAAATGLTMPLELETEAQELFEVYGGFGRGFRRRVFDYTVLGPAAAGNVGAGVNMAIRRDMINSMGLFDAELDCGTVAQTGGDAYAFYRLLAEGYQIVYTPEALVWHRHRRTYAELRRTLAGYSIGGFAFLTRCWLQHRDWQALAVGCSWFWYDHMHQLMRALRRRPNRLPLDLVLAQIAACPAGPRAYFISRKRERAAPPVIAVSTHTSGDRL